VTTTPWRRRVRLTLLAMGWLCLTGAVGAVGVAALTIKTVHDNIVTVEVPRLTRDVQGGPLNILVVGSDSREGLTDYERALYTLGVEGSVDGQRSDTVLLVSILPDQRGINVVSFPRDLPVIVDGRRIKLTESFAGGPDALVETVQENFGIPVHHYVEVSVLGFISTVDALGSIEVCVPDRLVDPASGANFEAGCQDMGPREALAYVRSRRGGRGDFERIERQQQFLRATARAIVDTSLFLDVPRLLNVVEEVAGNLTTDPGLGISKLQRLAEDLRVYATADIPMTTVPSYVQSLDGASYVLPYSVGALALFDAIERGDLLAPRGDVVSRAEARVAVWSGGRGVATDLATSTLHWSGFRAYVEGRGPVDAGQTTTVLVVPGFEEQARWVAATLGAPIQALPDGVTAPANAQVIVAVGDDAAG